LAKAITITTCFDTLDLVVGIATMPIDAFTPSVGATISTTFYYFKQGLKMGLIGY